MLFGDLFGHDPSFLSPNPFAERSHTIVEVKWGWPRNHNTLSGSFIVLPATARFLATSLSTSSQQ